MTTRATLKKPPSEASVSGRPTKLTQALQDRLINAIRLGNPLEVACSFANVSIETIKNWARWGEAAKRVAVKKRTLAQRRYVSFFEAYGPALAEATVRAQGTIHGAFTIDMDDPAISEEAKSRAVRAAQFHLTHREAKHYNTQTRTEVTGPDGAPLDLNVDAREALAKFRAIVEASESGETEDD